MHRIVCIAVLHVLVGLTGCADAPQGQGPGHREQPLALSPKQELQIGREAYQEVLSQARVVTRGPDIERVRRVSQRIAETIEIEPLLREINLQVRDYVFEWEYNVVEGKQVNAFCLPGGKIVVLTGLMRVIRNDDQLATVIAHEVAHALAHHASERVARERAGGHGLLRLSYDREQELEADHIGIFLMTFAGYDPDQAVAFWEQMQNTRQGEIRLPELLSDHPSDARRMRSLQSWSVTAKAAKRAYDAGQIAPPVARQ